jgi:hypothetical protein
VAISLAGAIFTLGRSSPKTAGTAWLHSVTLEDRQLGFRLVVCDYDTLTLRL